MLNFPQGYVLDKGSPDGGGFWETMESWGCGLMLGAMGHGRYF